MNSYHGDKEARSSGLLSEEVTDCIIGAAIEVHVPFLHRSKACPVCTMTKELLRVSGVDVLRGEHSCLINLPCCW